MSFELRRGQPGPRGHFERWESQAAVNAFRGSGPSDQQAGAIVSGSVVAYDVTGERLF